MEKEWGRGGDNNSEGFVASQRIVLSIVALLQRVSATIS